MQTWAANTTYNPGDLVKPATIPWVVLPTLGDPSFEQGDINDTGWALTGNAVIVQPPFGGFDGTWAAQVAGQASGGGTNNVFLQVTPGKNAIVGCRSMFSGSGETAHVSFTFDWYKSDKTTVVKTDSPANHTLESAWALYSDTALAPVDSAYLKIGFSLVNATTTTSLVDSFSVDTGYVEPPFSLVYQSTQADPAISGSNEPVWSTPVGLSVVDGGVTWTAVYPNRVTWQTDALMTSGAIEPVLPAVVNGSVKDGTIIWEAQTQEVYEAPHSPYVSAINSKIYAADNDIVRYCATVNPLDWTTVGDAGYIPFGLQKYGSTPCVALGLYRGNLVCFNAEGFQMWQTDTDPANIQLLDAMPIGCTHHLSIAPVSKDLAFLSSVGVRSIATAASSDSLENGHTGEPIDSLILSLVASYFPIFATYHVGLGQYFLAFSMLPLSTQTTIFVFTTSSKSWSRYILPYVIEEFCEAEDGMYFRDDTNIYKFDESALDDNGTAMAGTVQWPWLDLGIHTRDKRLDGLYVVCDGSPTVSIGYDSTLESSFESVGQIPLGSGGAIPLDGVVSSVSFKFDFIGPWRLYEAKIEYTLMKYLSNGTSVGSVAITGRQSA